MRLTRALFGVVSVGLLAAASSGAAELEKRPLRSPLAAVQTFQGDVEMRSTGQTVAVTLRGADGDHLFLVKTDLLTGLPQLSSTAGEVRLWAGHLVVLAHREGKAWHFSVPGIDAFRKPGDPLPGKELDAELRASYEVARFNKVTGIVSRSGPGALDLKAGGLQGIFAADTEYQDPLARVEPVASPERRRHVKAAREAWESIKRPDLVKRLKTLFGDDFEPRQRGAGGPRGKKRRG